MGFLTDSLSQLRDTVTKSRASRAEFRKELETMTADRRTHVANLRAAVSGDLNGARLAWSGLSLAKGKKEAALLSTRPKSRQAAARVRPVQQTKPAADAVKPPPKSNAASHKDRKRGKR